VHDKMLALIPTDSLKPNKSFNSAVGASIFKHIEANAIPHSCLLAG
jgi:hypothetical protein